MKNKVIKFIAFSFLLLTSCVQAMEENNHIEVSHLLIQAAYKAADQGDELRARELFAKSKRYEKFQQSREYLDLVAAVITKNQQQERILLFKLMEDSGQL